MDDATTCPRCGSTEVTRMLWGMYVPESVAPDDPSAPFEDPPLPDDVELGGCIVMDYDRHCGTCDHRWAAPDHPDPGHQW